MYLVSPGIYEKMLKCIDENDRAFTESLNTVESTVKRKRPSEQIVEDLYREELAEQPPPPQQKQVVEGGEELPIPLQEPLVAQAPFIPNYGGDIQPLSAIPKGIERQDEPIGVFAPLESTPVHRFQSAKSSDDLFGLQSVAKKLAKAQPTRSQCSQCSASYIRKHDLKRHVTEKHASVLPSLQDEQMQTSSYEPWNEPSKADESQKDDIDLDQSAFMPSRKMVRTPTKRVLRTPVKKQTPQKGSGIGFSSWI